jgi:hypothetical protein
MNAGKVILAGTPGEVAARSGHGTLEDVFLELYANPGDVHSSVVGDHEEDARPA